LRNVHIEKKKHTSLENWREGLVYRKEIINLRNGSIVALALILTLVSIHSTAAEPDNRTESIAQPEGMVTASLKPNITGDWRLILKDNVSRYANLTLYQADDNIFGYGNLTSDNATRQVTAGGSFELDLMELFFVSQEEDLILRLVSVVDEGCLSGDYRGYAKEGEEMSGEVSGCMCVRGDTKAGIWPKSEPTPIEWSWFERLWFSPWHWDLFT